MIGNVEKFSFAGKQTGKNKNWLNISDESGTYPIDWKNGIDDWKYDDTSENSDTADVDFVGVTSIEPTEEVRRAKEAELVKWEKYGVFEPVTDDGQPRVSVKWVITSCETQNERKVKARLVARGFEESTIVQADSPTAQKASIKIFLSILAWKGWIPNVIDIQAAICQFSGSEKTRFFKELSSCTWTISHGEEPKISSKK